MTLASLSCPIAWPFIAENSGNSAPALSTHQILDAAGEYVAYIFQAREDLVISHVGWRTGAVVGAPTADTRIETVGTDGLPTGTLWAANANIVSSALSSTTWTLHALTASASIAKGQFFAIKIVDASGTSLIVQSNSLLRSRGSLPYTVTNVSGAAAKSALSGSFNLALGSSATAFYFVEGAIPVFTGATSNGFNNTNGAAKGARFQVPVKCRCAGLSFFLGTLTGNFNAMIQDDSNNELSSSSTAFDGDQHAVNNGGVINLYFDNPVELNPGTWYRAIVEPTSAINVAVYNEALSGSDYLSAWPGGVNFYFTVRSSGVWTDDVDNVPIMDLLLDQFDDGAGGGGAHFSAFIN